MMNKQQGPTIQHREIFQYAVINHREKEYEKGYIYIYIHTYIHTYTHTLHTHISE